MKSFAKVFLPLALVVGLAGIGCVQTVTNRPTLPNSYSLSRDQLVIQSDFWLAANHRLLEELTARRFDLQRQLEIPTSDEPIYVYLFEDPRRFETYVRTYHPEFPNRRAFFLETDTRLLVYAQWGDRVAEDLRHEMTHAYLHAAVPNVPLWLDEGLAEYFEVPRGQHGLNRPHLEQLRDRLHRGQWRPDLARLESLDPDRDMALEDYAESWAWVHFLLETRPEHRAILQGYLLDLRREGAAGPLGMRTHRHVPQAEQALIRHIQNLVATREAREQRA